MYCPCTDTHPFPSRHPFPLGYYDYGEIDDFAGQNVDDDYLATAYSYLNGGR